MIFACGMCGGVIELAAAGVLGLFAMLTNLWNQRMRFRTLFSDLRKRRKVASYARAFGFDGHISALENGAYVVGVDSEMSHAAGLDIISIDEDRPKPPKWLASFVVIASILAFFALMWAVDPHHGFVYPLVNDAAR